MKFNHQVYFPSHSWDLQTSKRSRACLGFAAGAPLPAATVGCTPWRRPTAGAPGTTGSIDVPWGVARKIAGWLGKSSQFWRWKIHGFDPSMFWCPKLMVLYNNGKIWSINEWELEVHWYNHDSGNLQMMTNVGVCSRFFQAASGIFRVMFCSCTAKLVVEHLVEMLSSRRGLTRDIHISRLVVTKSWELLAVAWDIWGYLFRREVFWWILSGFFWWSWDFSRSTVHRVMED